MQKEAAWLLGELSGLREKGLLDEATVQRLRAHYGPAAASVGLGWGMILLATAGAALIGLGIILIFAHNWENWPPAVRVALSLLPLLVGQVAVVAGLRRGRAWQEASGLFTAVAIGASIALIAQTYQMGGDLPRFLLTWMLLALPLVYVLDASAVAAVCWLLALGWAFASNDGNFWNPGASVQDILRLPTFLLLYCLPLPHLLRHVRLDRAGSRVAWMLRTSLPVLALGIFAASFGAGVSGLVLVYAALSAVAALAGARYFAAINGLWGNPMLSAGRFGVFALTLVAASRELLRTSDLPNSSLAPLVLILSATAFWLAWRGWQDGDRLLAPMLGLFAPLLGLEIALADRQAVLSLVVSHLYALGLAGALIRTGLRESKLGLANQGVLLVSALVLIRFFDSDLSYVVRGIGFIVTGVGFFAAVAWLRRQLQETPA